MKKIYIDKRTGKRHIAVLFESDTIIEEICRLTPVVLRIDDNHYQICKRYMFPLEGMDNESLPDPIVKRGEWIVRGFAQSIPDHIFKENFTEVSLQTTEIWQKEY